MSSFQAAIGGRKKIEPGRPNSNHGFQAAIGGRKMEAFQGNFYNRGVSGRHRR